MFEWDDENIEHVAEHGVEPWEVEEAFDDRGRAPFPADSDRIGFMRRTEGGRLLVVILERGTRPWRVVTARDASPVEKRVYRRRNR